MKPLTVALGDDSVDWGRTGIRYGIYLVGLFCISLGTVLQTESGLGVASLTCFATFAARALGTSLGFMIAATYAIYIAAQALILRGKFQARILLEMVFAFSMGYLVDAIAAFVQVIADALGTAFGNVKVVFDVSHVSAALVGSLLLFGDIKGFGPTTVVSALFLGRIINVIMSTVGRRAVSIVWE